MLLTLLLHFSLLFLLCVCMLVIWIHYAYSLMFVLSTFLRCCIANHIYASFLFCTLFIHPGVSFGVLCWEGGDGVVRRWNPQSEVWWEVQTHQQTTSLKHVVGRCGLGAECCGIMGSAVWLLIWVSKLIYSPGSQECCEDIAFVLKMFSWDFCF